MSRIEEALRRAAAGPMAADVAASILKPAPERPVRSVLDYYPQEHTAPADPIPVAEETRIVPAGVSGRFAERAVVPRFGEAYRHKLVATGEASPTSIEQYRR